MEDAVTYAPLQDNGKLNVRVQGTCNLRKTAKPVRTVSGSSELSIVLSRDISPLASRSKRLKKQGISFLLFFKTSMTCVKEELMLN